MGESFRPSTRNFRFIFTIFLFLFTAYQLYSRSTSSIIDSTEVGGFTLARNVEDDFGTIGTVEGGKSMTFKHYLDNPSPRPRSSKLWLTVSDRSLVHTTTPVLDRVVQDLNLERRNQANQSQEGDSNEQEEEVVLVVLCADRECLEESVKRGWNAFGGYRLTKPLQARMSTWIKLCGILDALHAGQDVLFVDPNYFISQNPYPLLETPMTTSDLLVVENVLGSMSRLISSNFVWVRRSEGTISLWTRLLHAYSNSLIDARDDEILNQLLFTIDNRPDSRSDFVTPEGIKVHVLDDTRFVAWRPSHDMIESEAVTIDEETVEQVVPVEPIGIDLTCAGDAIVNSYLSKRKNIHGNTDDYYSTPSKILGVSSLIGTRDDIKQILKILITVSRLTGRSLELPSHITLLDVPSSSDSDSPVVLPTYATFPLPHLAAALEFNLVEPQYSSRVLEDLSSTTSTVTTNLDDDSNGDESTINDEFQQHLVEDYTYRGSIDIRTVSSIHDLVRKLLLVSYSVERIIDLTHFESHSHSSQGRSRSNWKRWQLPRPTRLIQPCRKLDGPVLCRELCRLPGSWKSGITEEEMKTTVDSGWLIVREMKKRVEEPWQDVGEFSLDQDWNSSIEEDEEDLALLV